MNDWSLFSSRMRRGKGRIEWWLWVVDTRVSLFDDRQTFIGKVMAYIRP